MNSVYVGGTTAVSRCNKRREYGVEVSDITIETFKRSVVTREAIKLYKYNSNITLTDVDDFIDERLSEMSFPNDYVKSLNKAEIVALVHRYLEYDGRKSFTPHLVEFTFNGMKLSYKPMFIYESEETVFGKGKKGEMIVPVVEVVTMTTGNQKFTSGSRYGSGKEIVSIHHNLDGLGLLMAGKSMLNGKAGIVRCCADSLKTTLDKNNDYSGEFTVAIKDTNGSKSSCNRVWMEVFFSENGQIVPRIVFRQGTSLKKRKTQHIGIYPDYDKNRCVEYDNKRLFKDFKETLDNFVKGKERCASSSCEKCSFYELCHYNHQPVKKDEAIVEKREAMEPALNREQQAVCDFREGICCVDAGPGAGKTQCMAYRIAKLLCEGTKPEDILVVSFSKSAVKVITSRVKFFVHDLYGMYNINIDKIKIGTFNSLGNELIEKYYLELGYTEIPDMVDEVEMFNYMKQAIDFNNPCEGFDYKNYKMKSLNRNQKGGVIDEITSQVRLIRDNGLTKEEYKEMALKNGYEDAQIEYIWGANEKYSNILVENNLIDYSDQCYQVLHLIDFINPEAIADTYRYEHIIVDEFQDSNDFQMIFLSELMNVGCFKSLMVVGDDAQAIYGFRGTTPDNIINFEEKLNTRLKVTEFTLGRNYRSSEEIVNLSNEILSHNKTKIQKVLSSHMGPLGYKPVFKSFEKSEYEIKHICDNIEKLIGDGVEKNQIAVICSKKKALKKISKELSARGILSQFDMSERLLDNSRVRASIGFCNFATDTNGTKGLLEYLNEVYNNTLFEKFSPKQVQNILNTAKQDFINYYIPLSVEDKKEYILNALKVLDDGTDAIYTAFYEKISKKSKLDVFELLHYVRDFYELNVDAVAEKEGTYDAVALVTAHSSKGKEWDYTFVSLTNFDDVPTRSLDEKEERRRLIFVACSRAKYGLMVTTLRNKEREGDYSPINPWYAELSQYESFENMDLIH